MPKARDVEAALADLADPEFAAHSQRFFRTGPGEYGEGDVFIGVHVPAQRSVARRFRELGLDEIDVLLGSEIHEHRLTASIILTDRYARGDSGTREQTYRFVLDHMHAFDNWDIVDTVALKIVGEHLLGGEDADLYRLAGSGDLWGERMAIVATLAFIRHGRFDATLVLAEGFLDHEHDLVHKAAGWMLREVGKRDPAVLRAFLDSHAAQMPRTMLRYAIEKLPEPERHAYMRAGR